MSLSMIDSMTAAQLLKMREPEALFCRSAVPNANLLRDEYRRLSLLWHPDKNNSPDASVVFSHVAKLYDAALAKLTADSWSLPGVYEIRALDGKRFYVSFRTRHKFELGEMLIGDDVAVYVVEKRHEDLFRAARKTIAAFRYPSKRVRDDVQRYLPTIKTIAETKNAFVMIVTKTQDLLLLSDVIEHFGSSVDPRHVAWIVSSLLNLACYLQVSGLTHNAIGPSSYLISPRYHSGALLGGWWYSAAKGEAMMALPRRTVACAPRDIVASKVASCRTDLELIRATAREMFGDITGSRFAASKIAQQPLMDWMRLPTSGNAIEDYRTWKELVLPASFGARTFTDLKLTADDLYITN